MASNWSAENAVQAYIKTIKMGKGTQELDIPEFISAQAAGNNAKLIVAACSGGEGISIVVALGAAAHVTGGKVVCILGSAKELLHYQSVLPEYLCECDASVECVLGEAETLIANNYMDLDFVVVDSNRYDYERILGLFREVKGRNSNNGDTIVLGYNAFNKESWPSWGASATQLLPIGEGLLLTRINRKRKSGNWVVMVDKCTGEEHVFKVRLHEKNTFTC